MEATRGGSVGAGGGRLLAACAVVHVPLGELVQHRRRRVAGAARTGAPSPGLG